MMRSDRPAPLIDADFAEWCKHGEALSRQHSGWQWEVGAWWAKGEDRQYGERYKIARELNFNPHSCETYASVARAFPETSRRLEGLSFSHHQEVAGETPEQADKHLAWCREPITAGGKPRSIRELRDKLAELRGEEVRRKVDSLHMTEEPRNAPRDKGPSDRLNSSFGTPPSRDDAPTLPKLDDSPASGKVSEDLRNLQREPELPAKSSRVDIAHSAIKALSFDDALAVFTRWLDTVSPADLDRVRAAVDACQSPAPHSLLH